MKPLPLSERLKVACYHNAQAMRPNWRFDSATGRMVCCLCDKPAPDLVLRVCCECEKQFVLSLDNPKWVPKTYVTKSGEVIDSVFYCKECY